MPKYIHVITATKTPQNRSTNPTPFEEFPENPNVTAAGSFGPDQETMFLLVNENVAPTVDPVLQKVAANRTNSDLGVPIKGAYNAAGDGGLGSWDYTYAVSDQDVETSRELRIDALYSDFQDAKAAGFAYTVDSVEYTFELSENANNTAITKRASISWNTPPTNPKVSAADGQLVEMTIPQFQAFQAALADQWETVEAEYHESRYAINLAATPAEVAAVSWDFSAV